MHADNESLKHLLSPKEERLLRRRVPRFVLEIGQRARTALSQSKERLFQPVVESTAVLDVCGDVALPELTDRQLVVLPSNFSRLSTSHEFDVGTGIVALLVNDLFDGLVR